MSRVAGIAQTDAQKSSDMYSKCRYMDEITGGRGITFATGTPISNSMVELYTMMRYLQFDTLVENGHRHFDNWAADFGEKVTAMELKPEGTGFRTKTRFAKFYNLPELINIWKEAADIQTADMLKLPTPEAEYITVTTEPSSFQQEMVAELGERAEAVRNREVEPDEDNMLKITSDGRKLALDQRLQNPLLPDDPDSKVNACVKNVLAEWRDSADIRGTQLVFCDLSTPKNDGKFNVYDDIKATRAGGCWRGKRSAKGGGTVRKYEGRTVGLYTKVSPEEKEVIDRKMALLGTMNLRAYLRKMAVDGYVVQLDMSSVVELVKLLRSISSNVNQIAHRCNSTHNLYAQDVEDLRQGYTEVWQGISELLKKFETL